MMAEVLMVSLRHPYREASSTGSGTFDNTMFGRFLDADIGYPMTESGHNLSAQNDDRIQKAITSDVAGAPVPTSVAYNERFCVTDDSVIADTVELQTGEIVAIEDYDIVIITHVWPYNHYVSYLSRTFPDITLIGVQDGAVQDVRSYSPGLQLQHFEALQSFDGYITINEQCQKFVAPFVETIHVPLPIPDGQFESVDRAPCLERDVCLGVATWNMDSANLYGSVLTLEGLRDRGYDLNGEIVGLREFQKPLIGGYAEKCPYISNVEFITDGIYEYLSGFKLAIQLTTRATAGRIPATFAGIGIPCIGNKADDLQQRCWSELSIDPSDIETALSLADRLLSDDTFYDTVVSQAQETITDLYSPQESRREVQEFISDVHRR